MPSFFLLQLQIHLKKLSKAHTEQAAVVQRLQEENGKLDRFKTTIKNQEAIITRLEALLEAGGPGAGQGSHAGGGAESGVKRSGTSGRTGGGGGGGGNSEVEALRAQLAEMQGRERGESRGSSRHACGKPRRIRVCGACGLTLYFCVGVSGFSSAMADSAAREELESSLERCSALEAELVCCDPALCMLL